MTKPKEALESLEWLEQACHVSVLDHLPVVGRENAKRFASDLRLVLDYIKGLEEGLRPFALSAGNVPADQEDFKVVAHVPAGPNARAFKVMSENLTAGNFRRAASLLSEGEG